MDIQKQNTPDKFMLNLEYGVSIQFSSMSNNFVMGDNYSKKNNKGINSLNMAIDCKFSELTDSESSQAIAFLQKNYFYSVQNYNSAGKFTNLDVSPFEIDGGIFDPYKSDLKFYCFNYNHNKTYHNCNDITARFICASPSVLNSVEPKTDFDPRIFHGTLSNPSLSASDNEQSSNFNFDIPSDYNGYNNYIDILKGKPVFASGSYQTMYPSTNATVNNAGTYSDNVFARFGFSSKSIAVRTDTRNSIFIDNANDVYEYPFKPIYEDHMTSAGTTMQYRMFDHHPSYAFQIQHSPKYRTSNVLDFYKKFSLYGFNPNLNNLSLEFTNRTDEEAKRILLFLESHLGSQKFAFHPPHPYNNKIDSTNTTPHRKPFSTFVCPEWTHTLVYKDNNTINATFIECTPF